MEGGGSSEKCNMRFIPDRCCSMVAKATWWDIGETVVGHRCNIGGRAFPCKPDSFGLYGDLKIPGVQVATMVSYRGCIPQEVSR